MAFQLFWILGNSKNLWNSKIYVWNEFGAALRVFGVSMVYLCWCCVVGFQEQHNRTNSISTVYPYCGTCLRPFPNRASVLDHFLVARCFVLCLLYRGICSAWSMVSCWMSHLVLHFSYFLVEYAQTMSNYVKVILQRRTILLVWLDALSFSWLGLALGEGMCCAQAEISAARDRIAKQEVQRSFRQASDSRKGHSLNTFEVTSASNVSCKRIKIHRRKLRS